MYLCTVWWTINLTFKIWHSNSKLEPITKKDLEVKGVQLVFAIYNWGILSNDKVIDEYFCLVLTSLLLNNIMIKYS